MIVVATLKFLVLGFKQGFDVGNHLDECPN